MTARNTGSSCPIVFLGPSLPLAEAKVHLDADYRPPVVRGDLDQLVAGQVVGIIDGEFKQSLSLSLTEVSQAVERGVTIFGSSSMGALRAADIPTVHGVGRIYEMYRSGAITREDEVSVVFDPTTKRPLTVPLVNIRYAVAELVASASIDERTAERIVASAESLHFSERTVHRILKKTEIGDETSRAELASLLNTFDLKADDAVALLRQVARLVDTGEIDDRGASPTHTPSEARLNTDFNDRMENVALSASRGADAPALIWEVGDEVPFSDLILFLTLTGKVLPHARSAAARYCLAGNELNVDLSVLKAVPPDRLVGKRLHDIWDNWGWRSDNEANVTLNDLGIGREDLKERLMDETIAETKAMLLVREASAGLMRSVRVDLLCDGLALKRELMRCGALTHLALRAGDYTPDHEALSTARDLLCRSNRALTWARFMTTLAPLGVTAQEVDAFVTKVARARYAATKLCLRQSDPPEDPPGPAPRTEPKTGDALVLGPSPKADHRFALPMDQAKEVTERLRDLVGITRVALLGELREFGIQISNVARPAGIWSSTYGSGKALSNDGAVVGGIMEETEKWAHEVYSENLKAAAVASYESLRARAGIDPVDPALLALPFDTCYRPDLEIEWVLGHDLINRQPIYIPAAPVHIGRQLKNDIMYSPRRGRRTVNTNGLASGFTREEALVHAICEYVERHADKMAELRLVNPAGLEPPAYRFVDLDTLSGPAHAMAERIRKVSPLAILHLTSEIRIPTFMACVLIEPVPGTYPGKWIRSHGWAAHPNPNVACEMAMCEAVQSVLCNDIGGREDMTVKARSLGRHERPRPRVADLYWYWVRPEGPFASVDACGGFESKDAHDDLLWVIERLREAGVEQLPVVDMTVEEAKPARVVRVNIPGLESNQPFHTGVRARTATLWDLMPRLPHGVLPP